MSTGLEAQNPIAARQTLVSMGDHNDGRPRLEAEKPFEDLALGGDVDDAGGLVEHRIETCRHAENEIIRFGDGSSISLATESPETR